MSVKYDNATGLSCDIEAVKQDIINKAIQTMGQWGEDEVRLYVNPLTMTLLLRDETTQVQDDGRAMFEGMELRPRVGLAYNEVVFSYYQESAGLQ